MPLRGVSTPDQAAINQTHCVHIGSLGQGRDAQFYPHAFPLPIRKRLFEDAASTRSSIFRCNAGKMTETLAKMIQ